ncbi:hypothetical protein Sarmat_00744 [Rickettsiales endosymbiont of Paramecium tredecaurelia]|uniref:hypothetical protein n=1 Tax=Candidatus Sarmatiella mevalonica TaxID=2770581 RepID=UPI00192453F9|nr:hypothetical protein [Candidatus Sarmatiella mevalonica]MBL3284886.1 hypothetical protein [Candidatus Sarmatiella mevalonica]
MHEFVHIIKGTPFWVWLILAEVLFIGIIDLRPKTLRLSSLFIIPVILLAAQYQTLLSDDALVFCLVIMGGSIASFFINTGNTTKVIKEWSIEVPGGYGTLIVLLAFFIVKYYFGYLKSTDPDLFLKYSIIESIISGLFSGYFIGRALAFTYQYLKVAKSS